MPLAFPNASLLTSPHQYRAILFLGFLLGGRFILIFRNLFYYLLNLMGGKADYFIWRSHLILYPVLVLKLLEICTQLFSYLLSLLKLSAKKSLEHCRWRQRSSINAEFRLLMTRGKESSLALPLSSHLARAQQMTKAFITFRLEVQSPK